MKIPNTFKRQQGKQILDQADYVFKLENKVKDMAKLLLAQEKDIAILKDCVQRIAERMVVKQDE